LPYLIPKAVLL